MNYEVAFYMAMYFLGNSLILPFMGFKTAGHSILFLLIGLPALVAVTPFALLGLVGKTKEDKRADAQIIPWRQKDE